MRKRDELTDPNSCMSRAKDDEMTFVLLGRDLAAPETVRFWIEERIRRGKNKRTDPQIVEAERWASTVIAEQVDAALAAHDRAVAEEEQGGGHQPC